MTNPEPDMGEELSDQQIDELLNSAAERLKRKAATVITKRPEKSNYTLPKLQTGKLDKAYVSTKGEVATLDSQRLLDGKYRKQANAFRKVDDPVTSKKLALEKKKATTGSSWYNMPRTDLTPELKRDLQLLKMRNVLDPHRHYKKDGGKLQPPEYSQVGTIIEGPTEFFSGRIENKQRKKTFVEEVLAGERETGRFRSKYGALQERKTSGKKAFYKALKAKRKSGVTSIG